MSNVLEQLQKEFGAMLNQPTDTTTVAPTEPNLDSLTSTIDTVKTAAPSLHDDVMNFIFSNTDSMYGLAKTEANAYFEADSIKQAQARQDSTILADSLAALKAPKTEFGSQIAQDSTVTTVGESLESKISLIKKDIESDPETHQIYQNYKKHQGGNVIQGYRGHSAIKPWANFLPSELDDYAHKIAVSESENELNVYRQIINTFEYPYESGSLMQSALGDLPNWSAGSMTIDDLKGATYDKTEPAGKAFINKRDAAKVRIKQEIGDAIRYEEIMDDPSENALAFEKFQMYKDLETYEKQMELSKKYEEIK